MGQQARKETIPDPPLRSSTGWFEPSFLLFNLLLVGVNLSLSPASRAFLAHLKDQSYRLVFHSLLLGYGKYEGKLLTWPLPCGKGSGLFLSSISSDAIGFILHSGLWRFAARTAQERVLKNNRS